MLYAGRTRVVDLAYRDGQLVPRADESYDMVGHGVQLRYACADAGRLAADLRGYLQKVVVRQQFVNGEGHCHAWLSRQFGSRRVAATAWATVDSESVIGFGDSSEKKKFWNPIRRMGRDTLEVLATEPQFGKGVASRPLGNEADLLFWAPQAREFLITEVKDGKSANGGLPESGAAGLLPGGVAAVRQVRTPQCVVRASCAYCAEAATGPHPGPLPAPGDGRRSALPTGHRRTGTQRAINLLEEKLEIVAARARACLARLPRWVCPPRSCWPGCRSSGPMGYWLISHEPMLNGRGADTTHRRGVVRARVGR